ncbi:MAG: hypothetical protein AAF721_40970 [Myxococcota bacterium]
MRLHAVIAALFLASTGISVAASAAPKTSAKPRPTKKTWPGVGQPPSVPKTPKPKAASSARTPQTEQGDSEWFTGTIQRMGLTPTGRINQLHLKARGVTYVIDFDGSCRADQRFVIAQHPELLLAWDKAREISIGIVRTRRAGAAKFCGMGIALGR